MNTIFQNNQEDILENKKHRAYRLTPLIFTFCEAEITAIDIKTFLEMGLRIVRFKMTHLTKSDKINMLHMIKDAVTTLCDKYEVTTWPVTVSIDVPNACIRTGFLKQEIKEDQIELKDNCIVEITAAAKFWDKCDSKRIYIDDPYIIKEIKPGTEIAICFGKIIMVCTELVNSNTVRCQVMRGDKIGCLEFVCVRGVRHLKPGLSKDDLDLIAFAKEFKLDIITINSIRWPKTLTTIREMFNEEDVPLILSTICEQEGLDNIDEIIDNSDGIVLGREFLSYEIEDKHKILTIQMQVGAKCKKVGKPFFVSGNILETTLHSGVITGCDISDITNLVLQGAGFVIRSFSDPSNVIRALSFLDDISLAVEYMNKDRDLWRMVDEMKTPVNAAEACILGSALMAMQIKAVAFIVLTVTGRTAIQLSHIAHDTVIVAVTTNPVVARQLQIYRGIFPLIYDKPVLPHWYKEMDARVKFAVSFAIQNEVMSYGDYFVKLQRGSLTSSYCDSVSMRKVLTEETVKIKAQVNLTEKQCRDSVSQPA